MGSPTQFAAFMAESQPKTECKFLDSFDINQMNVDELKERLQNIHVETHKDKLKLERVFIDVDNLDYCPCYVSIEAEYKETQEALRERVLQEWPAEKLRRERLEAARQASLASQEAKIRENDLRTLELLAKKYGKTIS